MGLWIYEMSFNNVLIRMRRCAPSMQAMNVKPQRAAMLDHLTTRCHFICSLEKLNPGLPTKLPAQSQGVCH